MTPRRVRILAGKLNRGTGARVYNRELALRLAARGHEVSVVCVEAIKEVTECAKVWEIRLPRYEPRPLVWRFEHWRLHGHCARELRRLELCPTDVVIAAHDYFMKSHYSMFPQTPWVYLPHAMIATHDIESEGTPRSMYLATTCLYAHLQRWALNRANRTLRFTQDGCLALLRHYGKWVHPRFFVNPMGIDCPQGLESGRSDNVIHLLWVGQLIPRKRIELAIQALETLREHDWRFDIVGEGESRASLEQLVRQKGLTDHIYFTGFQPRPELWYRQADLFLFPSKSENSPVAMLEAMSYGVPCLAMRADGMRIHNANAEIITDGVDGFLAKDDNDFRVQLHRLCRQGTNLRFVGKAARIRVASCHTWDSHLDRYELLFDQLLKRPSRNAEVVAGSIDGV